MSHDKIILKLQHFLGADGAAWSPRRTWKHNPDGVVFKTHEDRANAANYLQNEGYLYDLQEGKDCITDQTLYVLYVRGVPKGAGE